MIKLKKFVGILVLMICLSVCMSGCGDASKQIRVYNAAEYIADGVVEQFEKETGYKVIYSEFQSNEDMYTKIKTTAYDVLIPSDYMIEKLINEGLLQPLNFNNIPNMKYIDPQFLGGYYDVDNKYSVPYMWSTVGLLYDSSKITETVDSMKIMWNEKYKGKIFMLDSVRDTFGLTLKMLGHSVNSENEAELLEAKNALIKQRPLVLGYVTDEVKDKIISGEGYIGLVYSGEAGKAMQEKNTLKYAIPSEGTIYCMDAMVVPENASNKDGAEAFINFMQKPEIAAKNAEEMLYGISNVEGKKLLPDEIKNDEGLYPSNEILEKCEMIKTSDTINSKYLDIWNEIMATN